MRKKIGKTMKNQTIKEKIKQRRLQILIHSYIYYELDQNIVSDEKWNKWAHELVELQKKYPEESKSTIYYEEFKDFDGSTGMDLSYPDDFIVNRANYLLAMKNSLKPNGNSKKSVSKITSKASKQANSKKKSLF